MTEEELRARIAKNRAAALERLAQRKAEKLREAQQKADFEQRMSGNKASVDADGDDFMDDDDDDLFGAIDMVAIEKAAAEKRAKNKNTTVVQHLDEDDMMELSGDDDDDDLEIEVQQKTVNGDGSQEMSQLQYEESQEFASQLPGEQHSLP